MIRKMFFLVTMLLILITACTINPSPTVAPTTSKPMADTPVPTAAEALTVEQTAEIVLRALADKDMEALAEYVHPTRGVRFSPYGYVDPDHMDFMPEEIPGMLQSDMVYTWGHYDGSGKPIDLTFSEYFDAFVYSADFARADEVAVNERIGEGNSINNIEAFYPNASFVEYHLAASEDSGGMDWQSLRLVFFPENGAWYLIGVVNDQWTI